MCSFQHSLSMNCKDNILILMAYQKTSLFVWKRITGDLLACLAKKRKFLHATVATLSLNRVCDIYIVTLGIQPFDTSGQVALVVTRHAGTEDSKSRDRSLLHDNLS